MQPIPIFRHKLDNETPHVKVTNALRLERILTEEEKEKLNAEVASIEAIHNDSPLFGEPPATTTTTGDVQKAPIDFLRMWKNLDDPSDRNIWAFYMKHYHNVTFEDIDKNSKVNDIMQEHIKEGMIIVPFENENASTYDPGLPIQATDIGSEYDFLKMDGKKGNRLKFSSCRRPTTDEIKAFLLIKNFGI